MSSTAGAASPRRSRGPRQPVGLRELPGQYFRWAAIPTALIGVVVVGAAAVSDGRSAALGASLGLVLVLAFFGLDLLAMRLSSRWDPVATFGLVMMEYLGKIIALAILFVGLMNQATPQQISTRWVGIGLATAAVVFLAGLTLAYVKVPTFVVEPESLGGQRDIET